MFDVGSRGAVSCDMGRGALEVSVLEDPGRPGFWLRGVRSVALPLLLLLSAQTALSAEWSVVQVESSIEAGAKISEARWVSQRPPLGRYDTIQLHRYMGEGSPTAALLYLPGTNMNGQMPNLLIHL